MTFQHLDTFFHAVERNMTTKKKLVKLVWFVKKFTWTFIWHDDERDGKKKYFLHVGEKLSLNSLLCIIGSTAVVHSLGLELKWKSGWMKNIATCIQTWYKMSSSTMWYDQTLYMFNRTSIWFLWDIGCLYHCTYRAI